MVKKNYLFVIILLTILVLVLGFAPKSNALVIFDNEDPSSQQERKEGSWSWLNQQFFSSLGNPVFQSSISNKWNAYLLLSAWNPSGTGSWELTGDDSFSLTGKVGWDTTAGYINLAGFGGSQNYTFFFTISQFAYDVEKIVFVDGINNILTVDARQIIDQEIVFSYNWNNGYRSNIGQAIGSVPNTPLFGVAPSVQQSYSIVCNYFDSVYMGDYNVLSTEGNISAENTGVTRELRTDYVKDLRITRLPNPSLGTTDVSQFGGLNQDKLWKQPNGWYYLAPYDSSSIPSITPSLSGNNTLKFALTKNTSIAQNDQLFTDCRVTLFANPNIVFEFPVYSFMLYIVQQIGGSNQLGIYENGKLIKTLINPNPIQITYAIEFKLSQICTIEAGGRLLNNDINPFKANTIDVSFGTDFNLTTFLQFVPFVYGNNVIIDSWYIEVGTTLLSNYYMALGVRPQGISNSIFQNYLYQLVDDVAPVIQSSLPSNKTIESLLSDPIVPYSITAPFFDILGEYFLWTDNFDAVVDLSVLVIDTNDWANNFDVGGLYPITLKVTDLSGNSTSLKFFIRVIDDLPPTLVGPDSFAVSNVTGISLEFFKLRYEVVENDATITFEIGEYFRNKSKVGTYDARVIAKRPNGTQTSINVKIMVLDLATYQILVSSATQGNIYLKERLEVAKVVEFISKTYGQSAILINDHYTGITTGTLTIEVTFQTPLAKHLALGGGSSKIFVLAVEDPSSSTPSVFNSSVEGVSDFVGFWYMVGAWIIINPWWFALIVFAFVLLLILIIVGAKRANERRQWKRRRYTYRYNKKR